MSDFMKFSRLLAPALASLSVGYLACSASPSSNLGNAGAGEGGSGAVIGTGGSSAGGSGAVIGTGGGGSSGGACAQAQAMAELEKEPVDIILLLDNSGSMDEELDAVERNINVNFAQILNDSMVDYRVILISRHRKAARDANAEASTSICVEAPLSGLAACPADDPVFSERFYHFFTKIESDDSFDIALDTYYPPIATDNQDRSDQAPLGWSEWLRAGAKKVFLELSDDNEDMSPELFIAGLIQEGPEHFGTDPEAPNFVFHSIIGIAEKTAPTEPYLPDEPVNTATCPDVTSAGETYQELSRRTGGLRFPICGFAAYDVVFSRIAEDVATRTIVACDFALPAAPAETELVLDNIAVNHVFGDGSGQDTLGQVRDAADCGPDAFYFDGDRVVLCPEACEVVRADANAEVQVLFTCESTVIVR
jgi:hypothetical protein